MKQETQRIKEVLEAAVNEAKIPNLHSFFFVGSRNKHGQYLARYTYDADCWESCKTKFATKGTKYDFFAAHALQKKIESATKKPIVAAIRSIAHHLSVKVRLQGHNHYHHDKLDFGSDLFRRTGHVTLNN